MTKNVLTRLFRTAVIVGGVMAAAAITLYSAFYGRAVGSDTTIYIGKADSYEEVVEQLRPALRGGVYRRAFDYYAKRLKLAERLHAGRYCFDEDESVIRVVRRLVLGEQSPVHLVVGSVRTLPQLAGKLAAQIEADSATLLHVMRNKELRRELGLQRDSTIAIFIPNTYQVWWNISPEEFMCRMRREYDSFWNEERTAKLKRCRLTKYEVMTLASIVYEETKRVADMPRIAGVYINRLRRGMPLQACPTVKYAMGRFELRRILHEHLRYRSPFNTYINRGLPPAPICVPSIAAIDGVLNYEQSSYLFFCASPALDGSHCFARTLKEHNANSKRYSAELNRRNIK
ncbi:MAG: endolytic transglycosylase MltG [Alistipes sp.]|nr:endolytic transglycosylase MltG [Alistipes sp.]